MSNSSRFATFILALMLPALMPSASMAGIDARPPTNERLTNQLKFKVQRAWTTGDFATLEAMAVDFKTNHRRSVAGGFLIANFYQGFSLALDANPPERIEPLWNAAYQAWVLKFPNSSTARVANAAFLRALAFKLRGTVPPRSAFPDDLAEFTKRIRQCRDFLVANRKFSNDDPMFDKTLLEAEFLLSGDHTAFGRGLMESTKKHPWFYGYYYLAAGYYHAMFGGEPAELDAWIERGAEASRSTDGSAMFAKLYFWGHRQSNFKSIANNGPLWPRMKASIAEAMARYPDLQNYKDFVIMACAAADRDVVANIVEASQKGSSSAGEPADPDFTCGWKKQSAK